jgi:hypothetical protein
MGKVKGVAQLRQEADKWFSKYVRYRDSIYRDGERYADCITCGVEKNIKQLQAGHFVSRRVNKLRFEETNVNAQCLTKESNVKMFNGTSKSIAKLKVGEPLWAFNEETFEIERAHVENVSKFVPDELYEVELEDGSIFWATGDHRVVANGKWVYVKDMLHSKSTYDILEL